jgi:hypothetical protein
MDRIDTRPVYILHLKSAQSGNDAVRALRAALKVLLRRFQLRAISVEEQVPPSSNNSTGEVQGITD